MTRSSAARCTLGLGATLVLAMSGCRGATLPAGTTAPIRVGVVLSSCGTDDTDSAGYREAIELAVREVNAAGGPLPGRQVELSFADSCYDPAVAIAEAQRFVDEGVVAILGDGGSSTTLAIAEEVASMARIPILSGSATTVLLTELNAGIGTASNRFFARTAPPDDRQAEVLGDVITNEGACTRVAIMHSADAYGMPLARDITAALSGSGATVVATVDYQYDRTSYAAEVTELAAATPDCIALIAYPYEAGIILRDWEDLASPPAVRWIGGDALRSSDFLGEAGSAARIDGFIGSAAITDLAAPEYLDFVDRLRASTARPATFQPVTYAASWYDATALLLLAIADAESTDGDEIRDAIHRVAGPGGSTIVRAGALASGLSALRAGMVIDYSGASGPVDLSELGDVPTADYEVWRFDGTAMDFVRLREIPAGAAL